MSLGYCDIVHPGRVWKGSNIRLQVKATATNVSRTHEETRCTPLIPSTSEGLIQTWKQIQNTPAWHTLVFYQQDHLNLFFKSCWWMIQGEVFRLCSVSHGTRTARHDQLVKKFGTTNFLSLISWRSTTIIGRGNHSYYYHYSALCRGNWLTVHEKVTRWKEPRLSGNGV